MWQIIPQVALVYFSIKTLQPEFLPTKVGKLWKAKNEEKKNRQPQFLIMSHNNSKIVLNLLETKQPIVGGDLFNGMFANKN